jgi:thermosome
MTERQPIFILPENFNRMMGKDAQRNNIMAARMVADTVKTTLGPKGMDKMLVNSMGDIIITNDGVTILEEMQIEHPAAKMLVEVAKTQEDLVGDGTTTAVIIAGKLLENAERLLDQKIHPTVIVRGYRIAAEFSQSLLQEIATNIGKDDKMLLRNIAITAMTGKGAETAKEQLSEIMIKAVMQVMEQKDGKNSIDLNNIKLVKRKGSGIEDTELIEGIVLDKEKVASGMPSTVKGARIALIDAALEIKGPETDTKISISSPDQLQAFLDREERTLKNMVEKIKSSKANVVICQKGIDDIAQYYLTKENVYAIRRVSKSDMEKLAKATGAKIVSNINELSEKDLGNAKIVEEVKEGNGNEEGMTYIRGCVNPKALTILIRGGTEHVIDEIERAMKDALGDVSASLQDGKIVAGGGAVEVELAKRLRDKGQSLKGREQLAVHEFASALESIPSILAENAGLDPIDILTELKARHEKSNEKNFGIDVNAGKIDDMMIKGVIEPLRIKTQAIKSASEVAMMLLRIDDVIAAGKSGLSMPPQNQMPEY